MFTFVCRHDAIMHLWVSSPSANSSCCYGCSSSCYWSLRMLLIVSLKSCSLERLQHPILRSLIRSIRSFEILTWLWMCDIIIDVLVRLWQNIMQFSLDSFRFLYFEVCAVNTTSEILSCSPNTSKTY